MGHVSQLSRQHLDEIFQASPNPYLVLKPDTPEYTIVQANNAYLQATGTIEEDLIGKSLFEVFPANPAEPGKTGKDNLQASLKRVLSTKTSDRMEVNRYDIPVRSEERFEVKYWSTENIPVPGKDGKVSYIIHAVTDITEQMLAEHRAEATSRELREKEEHYRSLFEHNPDAVCSFDRQGRFMTANRASARLSEVPVNKLLGTSFLPLIADRDKKRVYGHFSHALEGENQHYECQLKTGSGKYRTIEVTNIPIFERGEIVGVYGIAKDITAIRQAEERLDKAYRLARIGTWEFDMRTRDLHWSEVTKEVHGFGPDYQPDVESTIELFKEGEHRDAFAEVVHNAIEHEQPFDVELEIISGKGDERWIRAAGQPEYRDGECVRFYGISQNVSDRRHAEINYKNLFDLSPLPKFVYDTETLRFLDVNKKAMEHYGYSKEEFLSMTIKDIRPPEDIPLLEQILKESLQSVRTKYDRAFRHQKKDGELIYVDIQSTMTNYSGRQARLVVAHDITEQQQAEKALKLSEQRFKALVQDGGDLVAILDGEASYTYVSPTTEAILGISPDEFIRTNVEDYIHPDDRERVKVTLMDLSPGEQVYIDPFRFRNSQGDWRWVETIATNMLKDLAVSGIVANSRDITDQMDREQRLKESLEQYDIVAKATSDTIWDLDLKEDVLRYNRNIYNMFGYDKSEVEKWGTWWRSKIHPEDLDQVLNQISLAVKSGDDRFQLEYRFQCADGSYKHIFDRAFIVTDDEGTAMRIIGAMQDVTGSKQEEERLKLLESVITNTWESVLIAEAEPDEDSGRKIIYANEAFHKITGYPIDEVVGQTLPFLKGPEMSREERLKLVRAMDREEYCEAELVNFRKDGTRYWSHASVIPVRNEQGSCSHWVVIGRDITDRKLREEDLRESLKEKETLLAEIHHRVKNNLAVVSGMMQLQAYDDINEKLRDRLLNSVTRIQTIASIHEHLYQNNSFVDLDFSANLEALIHNITETFRSDKDIQVELRLESVRLNVNQAIPVSLIVNEVITNILKHAFGEMESGTIRFKLMQDEGDTIKLCISDNGVGLPDDFDKRDNASLGLVLIENLSHQLNAEYSYASNGEGTVFTLSFTKSEIKGIGNAYL